MLALNHDCLQASWLVIMIEIQWDSKLYGQQESRQSCKLANRLASQSAGWWAELTGAIFPSRREGHLTAANFTKIAWHTSRV
jgi:hypothetical protein